MSSRIPATLLAVLVVSGALTACASSPETPRAVPITDVRAGDCFSSDADLTVATLAASCADPHLYEVLSAAPSELGEAFPGDDALASEADARCSAQFAELGRDAVAGLTALHLVPSERSWSEGDRNLVCLIASSKGDELSGSRLPTNG
ncbi:MULTISPECIES: septum formation family protein [unclassified Pseudoclavibacter]|uniref:septum formation family protein n=1 Tax=unclassified Pseudoclavibacter TaxID=2615177 RepID=UPI001BADD1E2|nr:septum formation family protein [Pseudoclavibacter sp. Marseille-Q4354]MBS3177604.1 septum formation family protein [Pseudoclavibacter sp. Marseille-Q4354]